MAAEYAVAGDVDPRVGEHLLDVLGTNGIAAYLQPASDLHPVTRTSTVPARPTDRLYVDRDHLDTARGYVRQIDSEASASRADDVAGVSDLAGVSDAAGVGDVDAEWARIVAGYHAEADADRSWPEPEGRVSDSEVSEGQVSEGRAPEGEADDVPDRPAASGTRLPKSDYAERSLLDALDTFGADLPDSDDEGYTPPPPPPLPRPAAGVVLAVIGIVAGLVVFLRPSTLPVHPDLAMFLGFTAVLAGFAALVWRLRSGDDEDAERDPDDGAVV